MGIYKRCGRCGKRLESGTRCQCSKQRHKEYDRYSRDAKSKAYYDSAEWKKVRQTVLDLDAGMDVYVYMTKGEVVIADTVHHIEQLKDNWDRRNDIDNLISLHNDTHSLIESMYKKDKSGMMKLLSDMLRRYRDEER